MIALHLFFSQPVEKIFEAFMDESDPDGLSHSRAACTCALRAGRPSAIIRFCAT